MRLYLVRHGETLWNLESRFQGWSDIPLSHKGEAQAAEIREKLKNVNFDAVYSSSLVRARRTAEIVVEGRGMEVTPIENFKEHGIGELDGLKEHEIKEQYPGALEQLRDDPANFRVPGGETLQEVQDRGWPELLKLAEKHEGETILLVAHHSMNKSLILKMLGAPLSTFKIIRQPPCTISIIEMNNGHNFVHSVNLYWQERVSPWHDLENHVKDRIADPEAVIFDMDGVLLDSIPAYAVAWRCALAEHGIYPPEMEVFRHEGEKGADSIRYFFREAGKELDEADIPKILKRVLEIYYSFPPMKTMPGAFDVLKKLKDNGRRLALVTGSVRYDVDQRLSDQQRALFDAIVTQDDVTKGKPDPEPYAQALKKLNVAPEKALVIENAPLGIKSAKGAGILTIGLTSTLPREELAQADLVIDSLERLTGWVGSN